MKGKMYPFAYFEDMPTSAYLTDREREDARIWEKQGSKFKTLVRDVYWGNVISRSHWGKDKEKEQYLLKELGKECKDNVFWIDKETLFFCAPFDICPKDDVKILNFKKRIYKIFKKCEIEVINADLDSYKEPKCDFEIEPPNPEIKKKKKRPRTKKKLLIRYKADDDLESIKEHNCVLDIFNEVGPLPLTIEKEKVEDSLWLEIMVEGHKVPSVRKEIIYSIKKLNMSIEVYPPIDEGDSVSDLDFTIS
ncbi:MAG: hypothetical protein ACYTE8_10110 [Planctomycetota bacterium]